ncbi:hypothetical protein DH2020_002137 [Rehmannia glutinosa]|uniref:Receptor-like serine/threonine-protein kinase n=1 Tax=Rehmannia glutinosa TaxID=99300 RepID=A0ABR0XSZ8_REHGL
MSMLPLILKSLLIFITFSSYFLTQAVPLSPCSNSTKFSNKIQKLAEPSAKALIGSKKLESFEGSQVILRGNTTITSENTTFKLGFFAPNNEFKWYLGIWYASIPIPTYVWVANRERPINNLLSASAEITEDGKLAVMDQDSRTIMWETNNVEKASGLSLSEQGNLVLLSSDGRIVWQSFDFPTDTWLPGMNLTAGQRLTSWKSSIDPTLGRFDFIDPFTPMATFGYTEVPLESGIKPPLTRFVLDHMGRLKQFTWSQQSEIWNMFWSQPENVCRVYGLCGNLGLCNGEPLSPCQCLNGFSPVDGVSWGKDDFSEGCWREGDEHCGENDKFEEVGAVSYERTTVVSFSGSRSECEKACLKNCSCVGLYHNANDNFCKNLYGSLLNLRNITSDSTIHDKLYVRVQTTRASKKNNMKIPFLIGMICCILVILTIGTIIKFYFRRRQVRRKKGEEDGVFQVTNLRMFSYKELHSATKGFSVKLGHGGFGAVFQGVLTDSSSVAVKRLERPGGGEKEFRAEVCTIGNIQHVNLVRLRGFCSENSHRLLVYDYMPNGPLSMYLKHNSQNLSWNVRFRVAVGTARGIAYLHEECRNCIIHCDIKPENILLDEDFSAKVSDFGLAKLIGRDFSRVLATICVDRRPSNVEGPPSARGGGERNNGEVVFPPWAARQIIDGHVAAVVDERLGGLYNEAEAARLGLVAVWCIQDDESTRPTMGMVVKMLEGVVEVTVPPPPKLLQALVSGESFRGVGVESGKSVRQEDAGSFDDNVSISVVYNPGNRPDVNALLLL